MFDGYRLDECIRFQIDLYVDDQLFVPTGDNFQIIEDYALQTIDGTDGTVLALGACWHGKSTLH